MSIFSSVLARMENYIQRMRWFDIAIFKLCVFSFALMVATFWPLLLTVGWKIWTALFLASYIWLAIKFFR